MKYLILSAGIACCLFACRQEEKKTETPVTQATVTPPDTGWIFLFDGKSLNGWHTYGGQHAGAAWHADSGAIHLDASKKEDDETVDGGDLLTDDEYSNFDLKIEWKISKGGNSGIIFYLHEDTAKYEEWNTGLEMQVLDNKGHSDSKTPTHHAGDLYDLIASSPETVKGAGEWNQAEIKCYDGQLEFYLNGPKVLSTTLWNDNWKKLIAGSKYRDMPDWGTFKKGHIALQDHGFDVWYRNIMIKKL